LFLQDFKLLFMLYYYLVASCFICSSLCLINFKTRWVTILLENGCHFKMPLSALYSVNTTPPLSSKSIQAPVCRKTYFSHLGHRKQVYNRLMIDNRLMNSHYETVVHSFILNARSHCAKVQFYVALSWQSILAPGIQKGKNWYLHLGHIRQIW
jgi:hypothetical protein